MSNGLPPSLKFGSRLVKQRVQFADIEISLEPCLSEVILQHDWGLREPVSLVLRVVADDLPAALGAIGPILAIVTDDLAFQLQDAVPLYQLMVLDLTPPVAVGDEREYTLFPFPNGYDQYKFSRTVTLGGTATAATPLLRSTYAALPVRAQDALDWYIKALYASFDADRFLFYWICLEILRTESGTMVIEPTRLRCKHSITECPVCGEPTSELRHGASNTRFLETWGVSSTDAARLWKTRQLVHGALSFTPANVSNLEELLQILRAAATLAVKRALGQADDALPVYVPGAPTIRGSPAVGGPHTVTEADLLNWDRDS